MTHKQKVRVARKMRTQEELKARVSIFDTKAWSQRKLQIAKRNA